MPASPARGYPLQASRRAQLGHVFAAGQARAGRRFHVYPRRTCGALVSRMVACPWRCVHRVPVGCPCRARAHGVLVPCPWRARPVPVTGLGRARPVPVTGLGHCVPSGGCGVVFLAGLRRALGIVFLARPTAFPSGAGRRTRGMCSSRTYRGPSLGHRGPARPVACRAGTCGVGRVRGGGLWRPIAWPSRARLSRRTGSVAASIRRRMACLILRRAWRCAGR